MHNEICMLRVLKLYLKEGLSPKHLFLIQLLSLICDIQISLCVTKDGCVGWRLQELTEVFK